MKKVVRLFNLAFVGAVLTAGMLSSLAQDTPQGRPGRNGGQGGGNFDPQQMRQRMSERLREQFKIKDDAEWKLIEERLTKVTEARMQAGGFGGFGGRGGPGGGGAEGNTEASDLRKAIEADAPAAEIKTKLAAFRAASKVKEAALAKAQDDLRAVLNGKQEAAAVLAGLLK